MRSTILPDGWRSVGASSIVTPMLRIGDGLNGTGLKRRLKPHRGMTKTGNMTKTEREDAIAASLAETKAAGPKPVRVTWDFHPAGWMKYRAWVRAENRRRSERRDLRRRIQEVK